MRSCAFNEGVSQGAQEYTVSVKLAEALRPDTAAPENFTVLNENTGKNIAVTESVYLPGSMEINLILEPAELSNTTCTVLANDSLRYLSGTKPDTEITGVVQRDLYCDMFSVSVQQLSIYQGDTLVLCPERSKPTTVVARVINTSDLKEKKTVVLFLNDNSTDVLQQTEIEIDAGEVLEVSFEFPNGLAASNIINVGIV